MEIRDTTPGIFFKRISKYIWTNGVASLCCTVGQAGRDGQIVWRNQLLGWMMESLSWLHLCHSQVLAIGLSQQLKWVPNLSWPQQLIPVLPPVFMLAQNGQQGGQNGLKSTWQGWLSFDIVRLADLVHPLALQILQHKRREEGAGWGYDGEDRKCCF